MKGEVLRRGIARLTGVDMPIFPKRRFQHGAVADDDAARRFARHPDVYRRHFLDLHRPGAQK